VIRAQWSIERVDGAEHLDLKRRRTLGHRVALNLAALFGVLSQCGEYLAGRTEADGALRTTN